MTSDMKSISKDQSCCNLSLDTSAKALPIRNELIKIIAGCTAIRRSVAEGLTKELYLDWRSSYPGGVVVTAVAYSVISATSCNLTSCQHNLDTATAAPRNRTKSIPLCRGQDQRGRLSGQDYLSMAKHVTNKFPLFFSNSLLGPLLNFRVRLYPQDARVGVPTLSIS